MQSWRGIKDKALKWWNAVTECRQRRRRVRETDCRGWKKERRKSTKEQKEAGQRKKEGRGFSLVIHVHPRCPKLCGRISYTIRGGLSINFWPHQTKSCYGLIINCTSSSALFSCDSVVRPCFFSCWWENNCLCPLWMSQIWTCDPCPAGQLINKQIHFKLGSLRWDICGDEVRDAGMCLCSGRETRAQIDADAHTWKKGFIPLMCLDSTDDDVMFLYFISQWNIFFARFLCCFR